MNVKVFASPAAKLSFDLCSLKTDLSDASQLADALNQFVEECDHAWEARLVEWAMDNGYPDFETVLEYAL